MEKVAIISNTIRPDVNGQALMLDKLDTGGNCYIQRPIYDFDNQSSVYRFGGQAEDNVYTVKPWIKITKKSSKIKKMCALLTSVIEIPSYSHKLYRIFKRENVTCAVACTGSICDIPATYLASKRCKIPFIPYVFDHYAAQNRHFPLSIIAKVFERWTFKKADKIIVTNDLSMRIYQKRFGDKCIIIPNGCNMHRYKYKNDKLINYKNPIKIVYTGDIYTAQIDGIIILADALESLQETCSYNIKLHIYTSKAGQGLVKHMIERIRLNNTIEFHDFVDNNKIATIQCDADMLFLPLSTKAGYSRELINTSVPNKFAEYIAAGRLILVYASNQSYVNDFICNNLCGIAVDETDEYIKDYGNMAKAIQSIVHSPERQRQIMTNARKQAKEFDINICRTKFKAETDAHLGNV